MVGIVCLLLVGWTADLKDWLTILFHSIYQKAAAEQEKQYCPDNPAVDIKRKLKQFIGKCKATKESTAQLEKGKVS